jgi:hypothetical protein
MKAKECFKMFTVLEEVYKKMKERSGMNRWKTVGREALSTGQRLLKTIKVSPLKFNGKIMSS